MAKRAKPGYFSGDTEIGGKQVAWESVFQKGTTYSCHRCGLCCNLVSLSEKDTETLQRNGQGDSVIYPDRDQPLRIPMLKMKRDGSCVHLGKDNLCGIYDIRPMMCRSYPFIISPTMDGGIAVNLSFRCPYINMDGGPEVKREDVEDALSLNIGHVPEMILRSMEYRKSLAGHLRTAYAPAFIEKNRRTAFIEESIKPIMGIKSPLDLPEIMKEWADKVAIASHGVIVTGWGGVLGGKDRDREILANIPKIREDGRYRLSKQRWRFMFGDIGNSVFWLDDDSKVAWSSIKVKQKLSIGGRAYDWGELTSLRYSGGAMAELMRYIKAILRRPSFGLTVARVVGYIVEYKNIPVVDYEISSMILSNALMIHLDPISRVLAGIRWHGEIEAEDVRLAICNIDSALLSALTDGSLAKGILKRIDVSGVSDTRVI